MGEDPGLDLAPDHDVPDALGIVVVDDRGSLPFALIHGEALVATAAWSLGEAGITPVDLGVTWEGLADAEEPVVLHDALCPMTPPGFLVRCLLDAVEHARVVVGVRPVTDTVKQVADGFVGATLDRDRLVRVCSPIVLPAAVVAELDDLPPGDFADVVAALAARFPVAHLEAPSEARRVDSTEDVEVLQALTAPDAG